MLKENFKVAVPEFPDRKTSITAYGAVKNVYDDDTGRINARVINEAIKSMSSQGGGTVVIPVLLYTSPSPRDVEESRMPSSA